MVCVRFSAASSCEGNDETRLVKKTLTIKCLQLLRAVIYNEIVKLPDHWNDNDTSVDVHSVAFDIRAIYTVSQKKHSTYIRSFIHFLFIHLFAHKTLLTL